MPQRRQQCTVFLIMVYWIIKMAIINKLFKNFKEQNILWFKIKCIRTRSIY